MLRYWRDTLQRKPGLLRGRAPFVPFRRLIRLLPVTTGILLGASLLVGCDTPASGTTATPTPSGQTGFSAAPAPAQTFGPPRTIVVMIDRTTSLRHDQTAAHKLRATELFLKSARPGDRWIFAWISSQSFSSDETFFETALPSPSGAAPCPTVPADNNPFDDRYEKATAAQDACEQGNRQEYEEFLKGFRAAVEQSVDQINALSWVQDNIGTDVYAALWKGQLRLEESTGNRYLALFTDMEDTTERTLPLNLRNISALIFLTVGDPDVFRSTGQRWEPMLQTAGVKSWELLRPDVTLEQIASRMS